jgi:uncharacterized RDD family membrane protein YckC
LVSHLIDLLALIPITVAAFAFISFIAGAENQAGTEHSIVQVVGIVVGGLYFALFWRVAGASPGKQIMGLRVVGPDGGSPDLPRSIGRYLVMSLLGSLFGLTWWPVLVRHDRRAIHDLLAGTQVVVYRRRSGLVSPQGPPTQKRAGGKRPVTLGDDAKPATALYRRQAASFPTDARTIDGPGLEPARRRD